MNYCLNTSELSQLIDFKAGGSDIEDEELRLRVDYAENWVEQLGALTYLFCHILERRANSGVDCQNLIILLYQLAEQMSIRIQECDSYFIEYMLSNLRHENLSLEEELVGLQNNLSIFAYGQTLRY